MQKILNEIKPILIVGVILSHDEVVHNANVCG